MRNIYDYKKLTIEKTQLLIEEIAKIHQISDEEKNALLKKWTAEKNSEERSAMIISFLSMNDFSEGEYRRINEAINRFRPSKKHILLVIASAVIIIATFIAVKAIEYYELPRVYCFSNNISMYSEASTESSTTGQLDIYGDKFTAENESVMSSEYKMIALDTNLAMIKVIPDNFFKWLFIQSDTSYIDNKGVTFKKDTYTRYESIFRAIRKDRSLLNLDINSRIVIYDLTNDSTYKDFNQAVLADDIPKTFKKDNFWQVLVVPKSGSTIRDAIESYRDIFVRLKTNTSKRNIVIQYNSTNDTYSVKDIKKRGTVISDWGLFAIDSNMAIPDILFVYGSNGKIIKAIDPQDYSNFQD